MATSHAVVNSTTRTTTGTKDYTKASIGSPKASIVLGSQNTAENTDVDDLSITVGMIDSGGDEQGFMGSAYEDDQATTDARIMQDGNLTGASAKVHVNAAPGSGTLTGVADFDSAVSDGARLNWPTTVDSTERRISLLHLVEGIDQVSLDYPTLNGAGSITVTPGFQVDVLIALGNDSTTEPGQNQFRGGMSFWHRADNAHRIVSWGGAHGVMTPTVACASNDAFLIGVANHVGSAMISTFNAENPTSTQYDVTNISGTGSPDALILSLKLSSGYSAKVGHFFTPSSTGITTVVSGLLFTPQFAFLNTVEVDSQDEHSASVCSFNIGACEGTGEQVSVGGFAQDFTGVANSNSKGWHRADSCIYLKTADNVVRVKAAFSSFPADGLALNYSTATAAYDLITNYLLIGKDVADSSLPGSHTMSRGLSRGMSRGMS